MLFNSFAFLVFLPIVFFTYWFILNKNTKLQNGFIVIASLVFYGWWDWRFLSLILFSSILDFFLGWEIGKSENKQFRKSLLVISILVNIGLLGVFKYFNFFAESFVDLASKINWHVDPITINVILPVGISFYTFQTLSYSIDVYKKKIIPTNDILSFIAFVSFFPQLVAGPIERAQNLLPQFYHKRVFNYESASDGMRQILWGFFKKVVIADNAAFVVNDIFLNYQEQSGINLFVGIIFFSFQIYGDFSGYSDIAIGTSRLFGFNLMQNFAFPYFSRDIAEFWRRWHISLSTWFRDYIYFPLGGSLGNLGKVIRNTFIIFIISGFWHGANWTFIVWGALNAIYFLPLLLTKNNRKNIDIIAKGRFFPTIKEIFAVVLTFSLTNIAWVFFRAPTVSDATSYLSKIFSFSLFEIPTIDLKPFIFILILIVVEWMNRDKKHGLDLTGINNSFIRGLIYTGVFLMILLFMAKSQSFIYFQF